MTAPVSPPANRHRLPSWFDLRLVLGILLVLVSVLVGARIVASADHSVRVWAVTADFAAGTLLTAEDVHPVRVRLLDNADRYLAVASSPAGKTLIRGLGKNELLPQSALVDEPCGSVVSLPVNAAHVPASIAKGQRVDVYATGKQENSGETNPVVQSVTVQAVQRPKGSLVSAAEVSLIIRVPSDRVGAVIGALRGSEIDVVISAGDGTNEGDGCGGAAKVSDQPSPKAEAPSQRPSGSPSDSGQNRQPR